MGAIRVNVYGASGHGKVIIDIVRSRNGEVSYVIDDNEAITGLYEFDVVHEFTENILRHDTVIAVGNNKIRNKIASTFKGKIAQGIFHAHSVIDKTVEVGEGTVVMANATINADTIVGKHCILNTASVVEHDCILDDFVHISPGAVLAGGVKVGEGTHVGLGAQVIPGIKIGKWCTIGAGAVVIKDVEDFATVVGNPGRTIKILKDTDEPV